MSKKKGKPAAKKAPKKKTAKKSAKARPSTRSTTAGRTSQATIFLFRTGHGNKIRTAPQRAYAGPGHIEWTVVNLIDGTDAPVTITWPEGGPWGKEPIEIHSMTRLSCADAKPGRYKYVVSGYDVSEDPEIEIPEI